MYAGFVIGSLLTAKLYPNIGVGNQTLGIVGGATLLAVVGALDDKLELPGWCQALAILGAGAILVAFGNQIRFVSNPFESGRIVPLGQMGVPVTLLWVLMVTKAVDCMDGMDGLAAGISVIAAATFVLILLRLGGGYQMSAVMAAALAGAALGFLRYNYPPAKIFMGTVGAQFLGFTLAGLSVAGSFKIATLAAVAAPLLVLGVPIFDTTFVVLRRAASGRKIHEADRTHLHHRLLEKGYSNRKVIWIVYLLTLAFCAAGYAISWWVR